MKCNCKKTKCLKLYCDCFAQGLSCKDCNCKDCFNTSGNPRRKEAIMIILQKNILAFEPKIDNVSGSRVSGSSGTGRIHMKGCNCKKSGCLKKYCECFQNKVKCTDLCKCTGCKNCDPSPPHPHAHLKFKQQLEQNEKNEHLGDSLSPMVIHQVDVIPRET